MLTYCCHGFRRAIAEVFVAHQETAARKRRIRFEPFRHVSINQCPILRPAANFLASRPAVLNDRYLLAIAGVYWPAVEAELEVTDEAQMPTGCLVFTLDLAEQPVLFEQRRHV